MESISQVSTIEDGKQLYVFYGLLNIQVLANKFKDLNKDRVTSGRKLNSTELHTALENDIRDRAVASKLDGWTRTFGELYATIQRSSEKQLLSYGVYLTQEEAYLCDLEEELEQRYYEKIVIPVKTWAAGTEPVIKFAFVYVMTPEREQIEATITKPHSDDEYLNHCIATDLHHFELGGNLEQLKKIHDQGWTIEVCKINTFELIRLFTKKL